jgi:hypothetical protein
MVGLELPMSTNRDDINDESTLKAINANGLFYRRLLSKTHLHHVSMYWCLLNQGTGMQKTEPDISGGAHNDQTQAALRMKNMAIRAFSALENLTVALHGPLDV